MPLLAWVVARLVRATWATCSLLFNPSVVRSLPWPYVKQLPRANKWIGTVTVTLAVSTFLSLAAVAAPSPVAHRLIAVALLTALGGLSSSWCHALVRHRQQRAR
jgi:hypothetical protein